MNPGVIQYEKGRTISVPALSMVHVINIKEIIRVQSISSYSKLFFNDGKTLVVAKLLRWFEENLPPDHFIRVHRTHLINTGYISQYRGESRSRQLELINGEQIDVAKRRKAEFLRLFQAS